MKIVRGLKHLIVAHEHNGYKPHLLREVGVGTFLAASIFLLGFSAGSSFIIHKTVLGASVAATVLVDLANETRLAYNEVPLIPNDKLAHAARLKGEDMAANNYFAHNSPAGLTPWHWFKQAGYSFLYAGENLAVDFTESEDVENAWLNSPLHRANILNVQFREIGIATVDAVYNNKPTTFVVQMFGTPALASTESTQSDAVVYVAPDTEEKPRQSSVVTTSAPASSPKGTVKGESVEVVATTTPVEEIYKSGSIAIARNPDGLEEVVPIVPVQKTYSTWYGRFLFKGTGYVDLIYKCLIILVMFSIGSIFVLEYKKRHVKHIVYGLCMLLALVTLIIVNKGFMY